MISIIIACLAIRKRVLVLTISVTSRQIPIAWAILMSPVGRLCFFTLLPVFYEGLLALNHQIIAIHTL